MLIKINYDSRSLIYLITYYFILKYTFLGKKNKVIPFLIDLLLTPILPKDLTNAPTKVALCDLLVSIREVEHEGYYLCTHEKIKLYQQ